MLRYASKDATNIFENIMAAFVTGNPKHTHKKKKEIKNNMGGNL